MIKKYFENEVFIIDEKDERLFEYAKSINDEIYSFIEELDFLRVDFKIVGNWN